MWKSQSSIFSDFNVLSNNHICPNNQTHTYLKKKKHQDFHIAGLFSIFFCGPRVGSPMKSVFSGSINFGLKLEIFFEKKNACVRKFGEKNACALYMNVISFKNNKFMNYWYIYYYAIPLVYITYWLRLAKAYTTQATNMPTKMSKKSSVPPFPDLQNWEYGDLGTGFLHICIRSPRPQLS